LIITADIPYIRDKIANDTNSNRLVSAVTRFIRSVAKSETKKRRRIEIIVNVSHDRCNQRANFFSLQSSMINS